MTSTMGFMAVAAFIGAVFSWVVCKLIADREKHERERKTKQWMKDERKVIEETYRRR